MNTLLTELCSDLNLKPQHIELLDERDTSDVWRQFAIWLLVDEEHGVIRFTNPGSLQREEIQHVADLYIQKCKDIESFKVIGKYIRYVNNAKSAAEATATYAAAAAYTSDDNAMLAATAAATAVAYVTAYINSFARNTDFFDAAIRVHFECMANKLIELLQAAPLKETP